MDAADNNNARLVLAEAVEAAEAERSIAGGMSSFRNPSKRSTTVRIFLHPTVVIEPLEDSEMITSLTVDIDASFFTTEGFADAAFHNVRMIIEMIESLPRLERLCVSGPSSESSELTRSTTVRYAAFPVLILVLMLPSESQMLKSFTVENVVLFGNNAENFERLAEYMSRFRNLQGVFFKNVRAVAYTDENNNDAVAAPDAVHLVQNNTAMTTIRHDSTIGLLDPVVRALASLPKLEKCHIFCSGGRSSSSTTSPRRAGLLGALELQTLRDLSRAKELAALFLGGFDIQDGHVIHFSNNLESNRFLKSLYVDCELGVKGSNALATMLRTNRTLETLHISIKDNVNSKESPYNNSKGEETAQRNEALANAVGGSTLRFFRLRGQDICSLVHKRCFRNLLQCHYFLRETSPQSAIPTLVNAVGCGDGEAAEHTFLEQKGRTRNSFRSMDSEIDFYLKLNRAGRQKLLLDRDMRAGRWVETLANVIDDVSCLHYFLSINPQLCCRPLASARKRPADDSSVLGRGQKRTRLYRAAKYAGAVYR